MCLGTDLWEVACNPHCRLEDDGALTLPYGFVAEALAGGHSCTISTVAPMPAYLISDLTVRDPTAFETYRTRAAASIHAYGGRYLVRGGAIDVLEGERRPSALVVVEVPDVKTARRWYASPEYAAALEVRDQALTRSLVLVDGLTV